MSSIAIVENAMLDIMYEVPFMTGIKECRITEEVVMQARSAGVDLRGREEVSVDARSSAAEFAYAWTLPRFRSAMSARMSKHTFAEQKKSLLAAKAVRRVLSLRTW